MKEYSCRLTRLLDAYLPGVLRGFSTYILIDELSVSRMGELVLYPIRFPGATRGAVCVDSSKTIQRVMFDDNTAFIGQSPIGCFNPAVKDAVVELYGSQLFEDLEKLY